MKQPIMGSTTLIVRMFVMHFTICILALFQWNYILKWRRRDINIHLYYLFAFLCYLSHEFIIKPKFATSLKSFRLWRNRI